MGMGMVFFVWRGMLRVNSEADVDGDLDGDGDGDLDFLFVSSCEIVKS